MARTRVVGQCRHCRAGKSSCCRPRRRLARGRQRASMCGPCRAALYVSENEAISVAVAATIAVGVPYFVYKCPTRPNRHHVAPNVPQSR